jgi:hypothetical protein
MVPQMFQFSKQISTKILAVELKDRVRISSRAGKMYRSKKKNVILYGFRAI